MTAAEKYAWERVCRRSDLVAGSGVCALVGAEQVALFYLPAENPQVYALGNRDPIGKANVLSRGILGDVRDGNAEIRAVADAPRHLVTVRRVDNADLGHPGVAHGLDGVVQHGGLPSPVN